MASSYLSKLKILCTDFATYIKPWKFFDSSINQNKENIQKKCSQKPRITSSQCVFVNNRNSLLKVHNVIQINNSKVPIRFMISGNPADTPKFMKFIPNLFMKNQKSLQSPQNAHFSTSSVLSKKRKKKMSGSEGITPKVDKCKSREELKKRRKGNCPQMPPCLKYVRPPGKPIKIDVKRMECGRICMPCCPKARYPPVCYFPKKKKKCKRKPNPRLAFSECNRDRCIRGRSMCDCCSIKPPPCRLLPEMPDECK